MNIITEIESNSTKSELIQKKIRQALIILTMNSQELISYAEELMNNYQVQESYLTCTKSRGRYNRTSKKEYFTTWACYTGTEENDEAEDEFSTIYFKNNKFLKNYLLFQLHTSILSSSEMQIGEYIIDNIDKNGYLTVDIKEISALYKIPNEKIQKILCTIQTFDPPGIGARNLRECLLIQLRVNEIFDEDVIKAVNGHLDDFAFCKINEISRVMGIDGNRVLEIKKIIKGLEPKPGRAFYYDDIKYIIPDVYVKKHKGQFKAVINKDALPTLASNIFIDRIKPNSNELLTENSLNEHEEKLLWLSKCIKQRKVILLRISKYIINSCKSFFEHGKKSFNRISIEKAEKDLEISSNIIKRIACNKYLKCSWGIYEIKNFFSFL